MLVKESILDILKPKSKEDIKKSINSLSIEDKEDLIKINLIRHVDDPIEFLDDFFKKEKDKIWNRIIQTNIDLYEDNEWFNKLSKNDTIINKEWLFENLDEDQLLYYYLESLTEKQIDKLLKFVSSNLIYESIQDILKPKSKEEIIKSFNSLNKSEKESLVINKLRDFNDDNLDTIDLLEEIFDNKDEIWDRILDDIIQDIIDKDEIPTDESGNDERIDREWILENYNLDLLIDFFVSALTNKELNKVLKYMEPDLFESNIQDILINH